MSTENRRYYWLKLKENFFTDKRIKRLRKIYYDGVETDFLKEIALTIDETEDDVMVTANYLVAQSLMEVIVENDECFLTEITSVIGSETASTRRSKNQGRLKIIKKHCNATPLQENCNGEIEIDIELLT